MDSATVMPGAGIAQGRRWGFACRIGPPRSCSHSATGWRSIASARRALKPTRPGFASPGPRMAARWSRTPLLFPGYLFVLIELQWHTARWAPEVVRLVMNRHWTRGRPCGRHCGPQGARDRRSDRSPKATEIPPRRSPTSHVRPFRRTRRSVCRHEAAGARRGLAGDPGRLPAGDAGRRYGRAGGLGKHWRRGWDSNPRWTCAHASFQDLCLKPLGHLSVEL